MIDLRPNSEILVAEIPKMPLVNASLTNQKIIMVQLKISIDKLVALNIRNITFLLLLLVKNTVMDVVLPLREISLSIAHLRKLM